MAVKDHIQHFPGLSSAPVNPVPNTVSRGMRAGDRSFAGIVCESGKPILDSEVNLRQEALWMQSFLRGRWNTPSGFQRGAGYKSAWSADFVFVQSGGTISDDTPGGGHIHVDGTIIDALVMRRQEALVAGFPLVVEYANTETDGYNLIALEAPTIYDGTNATVKRTDFVFLEVWRSLVAPSPKAEGWVQVDDASQIDTVGPDQIIINGNPLSAIAAPGPAGVDQYVVNPANNALTAANIATAINDPANSFVGDMTAQALGARVLLRATTPGAAGNALTLGLVAAVPGTVVISGPTLTGGADRPNKPDQAHLYRHGNVQSPTNTWLDDEINDPVYDRESSQRIQVQYRFRATGATEAVNYKQHPDGFSQNTGGVPTILAQGGQAAPVATYPFVPADQATTWLASSAVAYGWEDGGLWVAGDGSQAAAQALGALDGFVYAIPVGFVFRHNNASDPAAAHVGFRPLDNTNGGPTYDHGGFVGALGAVLVGQTDRPDGGYCDVIQGDKFLDLRRHIVPSGLNYLGELQVQMQALMDHRNRTWAVDTASKQVMGNASGDVSTRFLVCNEIGREPPDGLPPIAGNTNRGPLVRQWDHIARRFGDQSVVERVVVAFWPGDRQAAAPFAPGTVNPGRYVVKAGLPAADGFWYEGDVLHLDLNNLDIIRLGGLFDSRAGAGDGGGTLPGGPLAPYFMDYAPAGTTISDVLSIWHDDGHYNSIAYTQDVHPSMVLGLGTPHVEITLDANDMVVTGGLASPPNPEYQMVGRVSGTYDGSPRRIFVELEITYPVGKGTTDLPSFDPTFIIPDPTFYDGTNGVGPGPVVESDTAQRVYDFEALQAPNFRQGYREIQQEYIANDTISHVGPPRTGQPVGFTTTETLVSQDRFTVVFPRRVYDEGGTPAGLIVADIPAGAGKTVDLPNSAFGSSERTMVLTTALSGVGRTLVGVQYFAQDPLPNYGVVGGGWQLSYYFRAVAPQTAGVVEGDISTPNGVLPSTLTLRPLVMPGHLWTHQTGVGSNEEAFPYSRPGEQLPILDGTALDPMTWIAGSTEEWFFSGVASTSVADFSAETGLLNLHAFVQQDIQDELVIGGVNNTEKPRKDAEFRAYYPFADDTTYRPVIVGQELSGAVRHKVFSPFLATVTVEVPGGNTGVLFRKNELVLVVLCRFAEFDAENNLWFLDTNNRTLAAVYRTANLLLLVGE